MSIDTDIDPRKPESRDLIAEWVKTEGDRAESHALEAKSTLDFTNKAERSKAQAKIVKFILGVSNRDEFKAAHHFQGYAVMVIGVSQGKVHGVDKTPEQHEFHGSNKAYFGQEMPNYSFVNHTFEGKNLLFILVEPPVNGKAIYICSKNYHPEKAADRLTDGAIYYRDSTETKTADASQLREMINRLLGGTQSVKLSLSPDIVNFCGDKELTEEFFMTLARAKAMELGEKIKQQHSSTGHSLPLLVPTFSSLTEVTYQERMHAATHYKSRTEECINRLQQLTLPAATFTLGNAGTKALTDPTVEFTFPKEVSLIDLDTTTSHNEVSDYEIWPHLPKSKDPISHVINMKPATPSTFAVGSEYGEPATLKWFPGVISPGQTISNYKEPVGLLLINTSDEIEIQWRITDPSLSYPLTGKITQKTIPIGNIAQFYAVQKAGIRIV